MNKEEKVLWFFLVTLGLFIVCTLCAHLGWNVFDRKEGMVSKTADAVVYTAPDGSTAVISNGSVLVTSADNTNTTYRAVHGEKNVYTSDNGGKVVVKEASGSQGGRAASITVTDGNGNAGTVFVAQAPNGTVAHGNTYDNYNHYTKTSTPTIFYGPDGGTAKIVSTNGEDTVVVTSKAGQSTVYYVDVAHTDTYVGKNGGKVVVRTNNGNTSLTVTTPDGNVYTYTDTNSYSYNEGGGADIYKEMDDPDTHVYVGSSNTAVVADVDGAIPRSAIPPGDEDLYMLKSQALVPICPKCEPVVIEKNTCPPCPAPARCPEPQFECTKTFTSKAFNPAYAPVPVMSDFSSFGM